MLDAVASIDKHDTPVEVALRVSELEQAGAGPVLTVIQNHLLPKVTVSDLSVLVKNHH